MALDWSILRTNEPVDIAGNFARGYQVASTLVDKFHERNALATLAQTPNDPSALATLYQVNPTMGEYFQKRGTELVQRKATIAAAQQYAGGDTQGARLAAIGSGNLDLAKQFGDLDADTQKRAADFWEKAGPIAYNLKKITDPAARQAQWAQDKTILQSEGVNGDLLNKFDPTNDQMLDGAITTAQKVGDLINENKIEWHQVPGDGGKIFSTDALGHPVGSASQALVGGGSATSLPTITDQKSYDALPSGAQYQDSNGRTIVKGGAGGGTSGGFSMTNNPGALRKPGSMEFERFSSPQEGIAKQQALLGRYMGRGLNNVSAIVERYAPRRSNGGDNSDASVNNYIGYVSRRLGVSPQDALSPAMLPQLSQAMREFETGRRAE